MLPELRGRMLPNEPLAPLTWFRVGGPAQVLFTPADENDLAYFLRHLPEEIPIYCIGVGSNVIVRDRGLPGVVIRLAPRGFGDVTIDGDTGRVSGAQLVAANSQFVLTVDVRYAENAASGLLVPVEMREEYRSPTSKDRLEVSSTYSNFRRFQVTVDERVEAPAPDR